MRAVFVFGSNLAGRHGKGAALTAKQSHGAQIGIGEGLTGFSYAIPTKDEHLKVRPLQEIKKSVDRFLEFAKSNPDMLFTVTKIGCGLAGYKEHQIQPMFNDAPKNCLLPVGWKL